MTHWVLFHWSSEISFSARVLFVWGSLVFGGIHIWMPQTQPEGGLKSDIGRLSRQAEWHTEYCFTEVLESVFQPGFCLCGNRSFSLTPYIYIYIYTFIIILAISRKGFVSLCQTSSDSVRLENVGQTSVEMSGEISGSIIMEAAREPRTQNLEPRT